MLCLQAPPAIEVDDVLHIGLDEASAIFCTCFHRVLGSVSPEPSRIQTLARASSLPTCSRSSSRPGICAQTSSGPQLDKLPLSVSSLPAGHSVSVSKATRQTV